MAPPRCPVCHTVHATCGGEGDVEALDVFDLKETPRVPGLKRYPDPSNPGAFLRLNDVDAKKRGLYGHGLPDRASIATPPPAVDKAYEEGEPRPVVAPAAPLPEGALEPAGPTQRARAAAAARMAALIGADPAISYAEICFVHDLDPDELAALDDEARTELALTTFESRAGLTPEELAARFALLASLAEADTSSTPNPEEAPVPTDPDPIPAPDAPAPGEPEPKDKSRPAPGRRRRPAGSGS